MQPSFDVPEGTEASWGDMLGTMLFAVGFEIATLFKRTPKSDRVAPRSQEH